MVNKVILIGRLTADPEVRAGSNGTRVASLRLATNHYGKEEDGTRKEYTDFHSLVVFGRQAEIAAEYLRKGRLIYADGKLRTHDWEDGEGKKRRTTEVVVETFQMLSSKPQAAA
jgi:single-strand DNA-binding protein